VVIYKRAENEVEDDVVAHVEVGPKVAHVVESFDDVELYQLHQLDHQDHN